MDVLEGAIVGNVAIVITGVGILDGEADSDGDLVGLEDCGLIEMDRGVLVERGRAQDAIPWLISSTRIIAMEGRTFCRNQSMESLSSLTAASCLCLGRRHK